MSIRISNIALDINEDIENLHEKVCKKLKVSSQDLKKFKILRESIDARKKDNITFNYTIEVECENESKIVSKSRDKDIKIEKVEHDNAFQYGDKKFNHPPVIIGMGPAGLFAGLLMARNGYNPIIFERGEDVERRTKSVHEFWNKGKLNINSNVQFGEGGAGTFSDGKLTTRIKDSRCDFVLEQFVKSGAPKEILYKGKPHIGTDILKEVVKNIREEIKSLGGKVYFESKLEDIIYKNNGLEKIIVNNTEIPCEALILALGHSSRDTYEMLFNRDITLKSKPFAIGVRVEHLQSMIDECQYGKFAGHERLRAADYRLTYTSSLTNRAVYSFCMCPGGEVVAAASEDKRLVTNGMSYYKRDGRNANSALVVSVGPEDFLTKSPLAGMEFQRYYESLAYTVGGNNYESPIQLIGDFLEDKISKKLGKVNPTYKPGFQFADLRQCLPMPVIDTLKDGIITFNRKVKGFSDFDGILTGIETRTSAPVRIERNEKLESISVSGIYPAGEGAGYAGGIMSAAVDGMKVAESIMKKWSPIKD